MRRLIKLSKYWVLLINVVTIAMAVYTCSVEQMNKE